DANGDGVVDPADIFYIINYLFLGGPSPYAIPGNVVSTSVQQRVAGSIMLGEPVVRSGRTFVPVIVTADEGTETPQSIALRVKFESARALTNVKVHRAGAAKDIKPAFETDQQSGNDVSYLVAFDE